MSAISGYTYAKRRRQFRELLAQVYEALDNGNAGATELALVRKHVEDAMTDKDVRRDLFDRGYGKALQALSIDGDGEGGAINVVQRIQREIVRAQSENSDG